MSDYFFDGITPEGAYDIGESMGRYNTVVEATKAYEMGEIDIWFKFVTPKTSEEWDEWDEMYGEGYADRWKINQGGSNE